jgi:hypothetical protein
VKNLGLLLTLFLLTACQAKQPRAAPLSYEPSEQYPYGRANPDAPEELMQFNFMVGRNDCTEQRLNSATGDWTEAERSWDAYYFMNGYAIRDEGRSGSATNGNIRVYNAEAGEWVVTFFSAPVFSSGIWRGKKDGENIVLRQAQQAPGTDLDGYSTLTFSNISAQGFEWTGEWISEDGSVVFPFWRIQCQKFAMSSSINSFTG